MKVLNIYLFFPEMSKSVTSPEEIEQVATISANGDTAVGQLVRFIFILLANSSLYQNDEHKVIPVLHNRRVTSSGID